MRQGHVRRCGRGGNVRTGRSRASERQGATMWWASRTRWLFSAVLDAVGVGLRARRRTASSGLEITGSCGGELQGELDRFGGISVHLSRHRTLHGLDAAAFRRLLQGKCGSPAPETRAERVGSEVKAEMTHSGPLAVTWKCPQPCPGPNPGYSPWIFALESDAGFAAPSTVSATRLTLSKH